MCLVKFIACFVFLVPALFSPLAHAEDARNLPMLSDVTIDFDEMKKRGLVRVLVPYSRTLFYYDNGHQRGITAGLLVEFEKYLNKKYAGKNQVPIVVAAIPTTRDKLLSDLLTGKGDMAAGDITITPERQKIVNFSNKIGTPFNEIIITGPGAPPLNSIDDLSAKVVHVREITSFYSSLVKINEDFIKRKLPPIKLTSLPNVLSDEDVLEMVNAGIIQIAVADSWMADVWKPVLPALKVRTDLIVSQDTSVGWAFRKQNPLFEAEVNHFVDNYLNKKGYVKLGLKKAALQTKKMGNNKDRSELKKFGETVEFFKKYGAQYRFDHLLLTAQGYQESRLNQNARSHVGAIGVMQIMPATGGDMKVGNIKNTEPNIHAGAKYMDYLMTHFFKDADLDERNRTLFAFASYNAGAGRIIKFRKEAKETGYNPNIWFDNVERIAAKHIGQETVLYVRNIYKYYVAYKLATKAAQLQEKTSAEMKK